MAALEMLDVEAEASTPPALRLVPPRAAQIADRPTEDFGDTLHGLCAQLAGTTAEAHGISLACTVDHQQIPGAIAADLRSIALGLIASAYNSFAGGRGGRIGVRFHVAATGLELTVEHSGPGTQAARDQANEVVMMEGRLVRQLGGRITVPRVIGGICIVVMLPGDDSADQRRVSIAGTSSVPDGAVLARSGLGTQSARDQAEPGRAAPRPQSGRQGCPPTRGHFSTEPIAAQTDEVLAASNYWLGFARRQAEFFLGEPRLSQLPNMEQIRRIAEAPLPDTSSLDEIARRAREILLEAMTRQQLCRGAAGEVSSSTLHKPVVVVTCGQSGVMAGTDNRGCEDDRDLPPSGQRHARHHGPCLM